MPNSRARRACALTFGLSLLLGGCVPGGVLTDRHTVQANEVAPTYVPTTRYDSYSCGQLAAEIQNTNATIADMSGKLQKGEYDKSGSLIVTPFFLMYDNTKVMDETPKKAQELSELKGTMVSLQEVSKKAKCPPLSRT